MPKPACHHGRKERRTCLLKQHFPNCGATRQDFRWYKVLLE